jgi:hypothetical protein
MGLNRGQTLGLPPLLTDDRKVTKAARSAEIWVTRQIKAGQFFATWWNGRNGYAVQAPSPVAVMTAILVAEDNLERTGRLALQAIETAAFDLGVALRFHFFGTIGGGRFSAKFAGEVRS